MNEELGRVEGVPGFQCGPTLTCSEHEAPRNNTTKKSTDLPGRC